jgi:hypothetical protein
LKPSRRYTEDELRSAVARSTNLSGVLTVLGLSPRGANYETVRRRIADLELDTAHFVGRRKTAITASDEEIRSAVFSSRSLAQVLVKLKKRIESIGIDTSHFIGQGWRVGYRTPSVPAKPLDEVLVEGRFTQSSDLRSRIVSAGLKKPQCEECRRRTWNGKAIPLELDHVNGRRDDNRFHNLRLLCPNCHAQTPTYRGRNIGLRRHIL